MLLRSLLRAGAAVAFAVLIAPAVPSAAPPPGLAYDEIVRVVSGATPPPPGAFAADAAAIASSPSPSPTPAPRRRGFGLNIGAVLSGGGPGAVASDAAGNAADNSVQQSLGPSFGGLAAAARGYLQPRLLRYAFWNGWERVDDPAAQTATIRKCDLRQVIKLDLAAKTYVVYDPSAEPTPAAALPPAARGRQAPPDPQQPGTAVGTLAEVTKSLPPQRIENYPTTGYDSTTTFSTAQSTGSCRNTSASIETIQYLSALQQPTVTACPIRRAPLPTTASEVVTPTTGCRPTFSATRSGPTPPTSRLALYSLVEIGGGPTPAPQSAGTPVPSGFGFLTERGNLKPLGPADAALFAVPADFTKVP
jgi:hypothetical protein